MVTRLVWEHNNTIVLLTVQYSNLIRLTGILVWEKNYRKLQEKNPFMVTDVVIVRYGKYVDGVS